jgi:hypothetical protein
MFSYSSVTDEGNLPLDEDIVLTAAGGGATGTFTFNWHVFEIYSRLLTDDNSVNQFIPTDDIVEYNRNYKRVLTYPVDSSIITANTQVEPTEYGLANNGEYFVPPVTAYKTFPLARSTWGNSSIWYEFTPTQQSVERATRQAYTLKHGSMISEVIRVLLGEIDSSISHNGTTDYSQILYGDTNVLGVADYEPFRLMITQKTNITTGEFDNPAQKAPITLASILIMLRDTFQLYWYVEDSKLKIEHISWFKNGGSYSASPGIGADLTTLLQRKNEKPWGFESSKWNYDKQELAERIEFAWMDDVTLAFDGYPIEINSKFVQRGKIDEVNVGDYTSDIDYMLLNPLAINQDGFALMGVYLDGTNLFDETDLDFTADFRVNQDTGGLTFSPSYDSSGYIEVDEQYLYSLAPNQGLLPFAWYDENKVYISGESSYTGSPKRPPTGAKYIRVSRYFQDELTFKFVKGATIDGMYKLPFIQRNVDGADLEMQNGYLSWIYLHPNYWTYDLPSTDVRINDSDSVIVEGIKRGKMQEVSYPSLNDPDEMKLIKTYLGNGEIEKISVNLSSRMNRINLKYDTE